MKRTENKSSSSSLVLTLLSVYSCKVATIDCSCAPCNKLLI